MKLRQLTFNRARLSRSMRGLTIMALLLTLAVPFGVIRTATASQVTQRSLQLSDSTIAATGVSYNFGFTTMTAGNVGSITFDFCSNYQYEDGDPCTAPSGLDVSAATLDAQAGVTNFSLVPPVSSNKLLITRTAANVSPQPLAYVFGGLVNPDTVGSNYVRISTHTSTNGTGAETDFGVVVFATNIGIGITTEVPPYLLFCVGITIDGFNCGTATGSAINFGELSDAETRSGTSQYLTSTNAQYGYSVTLAGTTMTAGNNVIPAMNTEPSSQGISQFGVNAMLNANPPVGADPFGPGVSTPKAGYNTPNMFRFKTGEIISSRGDSEDYRKFTVSYIVNVSPDQPPGYYVATVTYICLANF